MPWSYKLSTNNRTLIHNLGHYVLHSDMGSKKTMFINWDKNNLKIEYEANMFWKAFLNFENIPDNDNFYINA
jgi:Zn-dependent peptidase ImmA (M78 family)